MPAIRNIRVVCIEFNVGEYLAIDNGARVVSDVITL